MIVASAEDIRALLERIGGTERALIEQQARADQASTALQALQQQQQQSATTAQQAQRSAAATQAAGAGASAVVDTRLLSKPMAFGGRETSWRSFKHPRTALDEFEAPLRVYSALSGEDVSESLKVALVQKGITDDALKTHLVLHASGLSIVQLVRGFAAC